jgi:hypothetical protein
MSTLDSDLAAVRVKQHAICSQHITGHCPPQEPAHKVRVMVAA